MPAPEQFSPPVSFTNATEIRGQDLDTSFHAVQQSIRTIVAAILGLLRTDGKLLNSSVGTVQLTDELIKFIAGQNQKWTLRGAWQPNYRYEMGCIVENGNYGYIATVDHNSGNSFTTDKNAGYWQILSSDTGVYATSTYVDTQLAALEAAVIADILAYGYETVAHAVATYAPKVSPTFTGSPKAPVFTLADIDDTLIATIGSFRNIFTSQHDWTRAQNVAQVTIPYATTIATDATLSNTFSITMTGNATLGNPTGLVAGGTYVWNISQDGTGSRTLSYGSLFKFPGGTIPALTTAANSKDTLTAVYDGTILRSVMVKDFK